MTLNAEKEYEHHGTTAGPSGRGHDSIRELSKKLDALRRHARHTANAESRPNVSELQSICRDFRRQAADVHPVRKLIAAEI